MKTIEAINPWTKNQVTLTEEDMINPPDCYPFDSELSDQVSGDFETDWDWVVAYSKLVTPEIMGIILIGS